MLDESTQLAWSSFQVYTFLIFFIPTYPTLFSILCNALPGRVFVFNLIPLGLAFLLVGSLRHMPIHPLIFSALHIRPQVPSLIDSVLPSQKMSPVGSSRASDPYTVPYKPNTASQFCCFVPIFLFFDNVFFFSRSFPHCKGLALHCSLKSYFRDDSYST